MCFCFVNKQSVFAAKTQGFWQSLKLRIWLCYFEFLLDEVLFSFAEKKPLLSKAEKRPVFLLDEVLFQNFCYALFSALLRRGFFSAKLKKSSALLRVCVFAKPFPYRLSKQLFSAKLKRTSSNKNTGFFLSFAEKRLFFSKAVNKLRLLTGVV